MDSTTPGDLTDQAWAHHTNPDTPMGEADTAAMLVRLNTILALLGHPHLTNMNPVLAAEDKLPAYLGAIHNTPAPATEGPGVVWVEHPKSELIMVKYALPDETGTLQTHHRVMAFSGPGGMLLPLGVDGDMDTMIPTSPVGVALVLVCRIYDMVPRGMLEAGDALLEGLVPEHEREFGRQAYEYTLGYTLRAADAGSAWLTIPDQRE